MSWKMLKELKQILQFVKRRFKKQEDPKNHVQQKKQENIVEKQKKTVNKLKKNENIIILVLTIQVILQLEKKSKKIFGFRKMCLLEEFGKTKKIQMKLKNED